jgi:hypothetical protein
MCSGFLGCVDHWQTLIAGFLAVTAAVVTVWGTIFSANREIKAARAAAQDQIVAAQDQTKAAEHQTATLRDIEDRRSASETLAFYSLLEAAARCVINDVEAAKEMAKHFPLSILWEESAANDARKRIQRTGFTELRNGLLRFGSPLTAPFLRLDAEIERFTNGPISEQAAFREQLSRIEQQAIELSSKAIIEMKRYRLLSEEPK